MKSFVSRYTNFGIVLFALAALSAPFMVDQSARAADYVLVPIGNDVAVNPANGNLYVLGDGQITIIDGEALEVVGDPVPVGTEAREMVLNPANGNLYVLGDGQITIIDGEALEVVGDPVPVCECAYALAVNPANGNMYVVNFIEHEGDYTLTVIDGSTNTVIVDEMSVIGSLPTFPYSTIFVNENLYIVDRGDNTITVIDGATNTIVGDPIPVGNGPVAAAFHPANGNIYVVNDFVVDRVDVIDGATNSVIDDPIPLVGVNLPYAIGVNHTNGNVYVFSCEDSACNDKVLTVIDADTHAVIGSTVFIGSSPVAIGTSPDTGDLYAVNFSDGSVSVVESLQPISPPQSPSVVFSSHFRSFSGPGEGAIETSDIVSIECPPDSFGWWAVAGSATIEGDSLQGAWATVGSRGAVTDDSGPFHQMVNDGVTFELRGVRTGAIPDEMAMICAGAPVTNNVSPVVLTGDCGPDSEITFMVGDEIRMVFIGDSMCILPVTSIVQLTVNSVDLSDNPVNGMWTVIRSADGDILKTGFTPLTFTGISGNSYKVSVANYDGKIFKEWEDGSASKMRTINLSSDTTLTATYDTGDTLRGFTSLTYTGTGQQPDLTVNATTLDGSKVLHMWTIIDPQSIDESGTTYKVYIHNYQDRIFDHWEDGSMDRVRTLTISEDTQITAYYNTG
jgi:YVTN family beta-propeller protein